MRYGSSFSIFLNSFLSTLVKFLSFLPYVASLQWMISIQGRYFGKVMGLREEGSRRF